MPQPRRRRLGPLQAIEYPASAGSPTIVCLHGYGANAEDLASLAAELNLDSPTRWVFPDAPLALGQGFMAQGRAWFPIDQAELMRAQMGGSAIKTIETRPKGFDEALHSLLGFIDALETPWESIIIGGFSQGALMSLEVALHAPSAPKGLFILSGTLMDETSLLSRVPGRAGLRFFQSHGRQDPLLSYESAERLGRMLKEAGLEGELFSFNGGHTVPSEAAQALEEYINSVLKLSSPDAGNRR